MMVPRAFIYTAPPPPPRSPTHNEKNSSGWRSRSSSKDSQKRVESSSRSATPKPATASLPHSVAPSKPVSIPAGKQKGDRSDTRRTKKKDERIANIEYYYGNVHDPNATPPAVAALLAVTTIPTRSRTRRDRRSHLEPEVFGLVERRHRGTDRRDKNRPTRTSSLGNGHFEFLLSPPEDLVSDDASSADCSSEPLSLRTDSSESVPSLEDDNECTPTNSMPTTPSVRSLVALRDRKARASSPSPSQLEDCASDHPLLHVDDEDIFVIEEISKPKIQAQLSRPARSSPLKHSSSTSSFKSNLTASLRALKSAAKSFSKYAVPPIQQHDVFAQNILSFSPSSTDDKRPTSPIHSTEPPPADVRRYLNPISPVELNTYQDFPPTSASRARNRRCTASIQLQTCYPPLTRSAQASSPPIFAGSGICMEEPVREAANEMYLAETLTGPNAVYRQREPRENCDFLRIIVMEMNMRRAGKLDDAAPGKAHLFLPPRRPCQKHDVSDEGIPSRWIGIIA